MDLCETVIRKGEEKDLPILAQLACALWPGHGPEEMEAEYGSLLKSPDAAFFLAFREARAVGFSQCQLRRDYVEGTSSSPVGYLEGIYVAPEYRRQGMAGALLEACQSWAKARGCTEFASDCELENADSLRFHLGLGFREANRIICFTKKLC